MKGLVSKGHQVDVISSFPQKELYPNYTDIVNVEIPSVKNKITYEFMKKEITGDIAKIIAVNYGNKICQAYLGHPAIQKLVYDPSDLPYDAMIMEV